MGNRKKITPDYIFETSWEVCNKVGGIYTVLSTRAKTLQDLFKDKLIFIGPDIWKNSDAPDFIESKILLKAWKKQALEKENLKVRVGRWNVPGKPMAILVDFYPYYETKDQIYFNAWEKHQINSTVGYGDYDESNMFAYASGLVIESLYNFLQLQNQKVIAHFNEWILGMGLLYVHDKLPAIATIFTTHATSIGRSIAGNHKPLYDQFYNFNGDQMAQELNMEGKHFLEKRAAWNADCFTTVSEITGKEAKQLLERNPDIITLNGFEANFVPSGKKFETKRQIARKALINVVEKLTGTILPEDAFLLATSGRYEYKNKGLDLFIETMNQVRWAQPERPMVAFILVPAWIKGVRKDLQERLQNNISADFPLNEPFYTHDLFANHHDSVCSYLRHLNFTNQQDEKVKIVFVPSYLHGDDGIFNLPYYDLLIGLDLTIFPSYYEPWGYTPLESIAFHVPTITTNLAGFGLWAASEENDSTTIDSGVELVERSDHNYYEAAEQIKNAILKYSTEYSSEEVAKTRKAASDLSGKAAWSHFIHYYLDAYDIAFKNTELRIKSIKKKEI
jgi:glycogen synthase